MKIAAMDDLTLAKADLGVVKAACTLTRARVQVTRVSKSAFAHIWASLASFGGTQLLDEAAAAAANLETQAQAFDFDLASSLSQATFAGATADVAVYKVVLDTRGGAAPDGPERLLVVRLERAQEVVVDDAADAPRIERWDAGDHVLRIPGSGRLTLRLVASRLRTGAIRVRHAGMADGVWQTVRPDEDNSARLGSVTADELLSPSNGARSPLGGDATAEDANYAAELITKLARVGDGRKASAGVGAGDLFGDVGELFEDLGETLLEAGEDLGREVVTAAKDLAPLDPAALLEAAKDIDPIRGAQAARNVFANADVVGVVSSAADELANVVQLVGQAVVDGVTTTWRVVVDTVEDAMTAIGAFFKRVGGRIEDLLDALADVTDWKRYVAKSDELYASFLGAFASAQGAVQGQRDAAQEGLDNDGHVPAVSAISDALAGVDTWPSDANATVAELFDQALPGVPGADVLELVSDALADLLEKVTFKLPNIDVGLPSIEVDWIEEVIAAVPEVKLNPLDQEVRPLVTWAKGAWDDHGAPLVDEGWPKILDVVLAALGGVETALTQRIAIPWVTDYLEDTMLGGRKLTVLRLVTLLAAVPMVLIEEAEDEAANFGDNQLAWGITLGSLGCINAFVAATRAIEDMGLTDNPFGRKLARVHGFCLVLEACCHYAAGADLEEPAYHATGSLTLVSGACTVVASYADEGATPGFKTIIDLFLLLTDSVVGVGWISFAGYIATRDDADGSDAYSFYSTLGYWLANGLIGWAGPVAKVISVCDPTPANKRLAEKVGSTSGWLGVGLNASFCIKGAFDTGFSAS